MIEISVVIPTYNNKTMLREIIKSLLIQKFPKGSFEIIVVDDGSIDKTANVIESFHLSNLVYIRQKNRGPASARNKGISIAKGGIIAFIDDDCIPEKNWLISIKREFKKNVVGVEGMTLPTEGIIYPDSHYIKNLSGKMYLTCNIAFLSSFIKKHCFDENYKYPNREDSDLAFRVISCGGKIVFSKNVVVKHRILKTKLKKLLKRKLYFQSDVLLFKKYPTLYKKYIKFPFEMFTPFYILVLLLTTLNQYFSIGLFVVTILEVFYRKYKFSVKSFLKFLIAQSLGSVLNVLAVVYGCIKYKVNPIRLLF